MTRIAVIGGGAAGMFCAANLSPKFETVVFEAGESALRKVCASGGGRCNFTNENVDTGNPADFYPRGGGSLKKPFKRFGAADAREFFESLGVDSKVEDGGRVFPVCDNARAIAGAIYRKAERNGAKIEFSARVFAIEKTSDGRFALKYTGADKEPFDAVVVAVGGTFGGGLKESVEKFGIKTMPPVASLFSLETDTANDPAWRGLAGISLDAELSFAPESGRKTVARGSLLIAKFGIGGPATLKFSSFGARAFAEKNYKFGFRANFAPDFDEAAVRKSIADAREKFAKRKVANAPLFGIPQKLWEYLAEKSGAGETVFANLPKNAERALAENVSAFKISATGKSAHKEEFVMCGGVDRTEIDFASMMSKKVGGLFFCGECLDIDAITGGFNLQAAWTEAKICADFINKSFNNPATS